MTKMSEIISKKDKLVFYSCSNEKIALKYASFYILYMFASSHICFAFGGWHSLSRNTTSILNKIIDRTRVI